MLAVEALKLHATATKTRSPNGTASPPLAVRILTPFASKPVLGDSRYDAAPASSPGGAAAHTITSRPPRKRILFARGGRPMGKCLSRRGRWGNIFPRDGGRPRGRAPGKANYANHGLRVVTVGGGLARGAGAEPLAARPHLRGRLHRDGGDKTLVRQLRPGEVPHRLRRIAGAAREPRGEVQEPGRGHGVDVCGAAVPRDRADLPRRGGEGPENL